MSAERLAEITDEIAEFAQLEELPRSPMRSYSSGMRMRLASSVAVFLDPEILLIDEALTGGDAASRHTSPRGPPSSPARAARSCSSPTA